MLLTSASLLFACSQDSNEKTPQNSVIGNNQPLDENSLEVSNSEEFSFTTFETDNGWGYDIFQNGQLYIHQPHIPATAGIQGFGSESDAKSCAEFAIEKINAGILPPTLSVDELDSLGVLLP